MKIFEIDSLFLVSIFDLNYEELLDIFLRRRVYFFECKISSRFDGKCGISFFLFEILSFDVT